MRALLLSGGIRHDFAGNTPRVEAQLAAAGFQVQVTTDLAAGIRQLAREPVELIAVMALRWPMDNHPKYAPYREQHAFSMPADCQRTLSSHVHAGGGLLGIHTACLCFDDWPGWRDLLGGRWQWGRSHHPPPAMVRVRAVAEHVLVDDLPPFDIVDEVYSALDLAPGIQPLLTAAVGNGEEPVLWTHRFGQGRVVFDALGHDAASLDHPVHGRLLRRAASWAAGLGDDEVRLR